MAASNSPAEQLITENIDIWTSAIKKRGSQGRGSSKKIELYGIKKLRELILELAVRGLLVPQDPNDEPASVLLEKVFEEKNLIANDRRIRKDKAFFESNRLFEIPKTWSWVCIGNIAHVLGGKRVPKGYTLQDERTEYAYIRVTDMKNMSVDIDGLKFISNDVFEQISKYVINKEDVYVTIAGTIGAAGTIPDELDGMNLTENSAKLVFKGIDKVYLTYLLSSKYVQAQFKESMNQMAQPKLSLNSIKETSIALAPVAEQHRIVTKVNELMTLCDQLEQQTESSLTAHQTLVETLLNTLLNADQNSFDPAWERIAQHFDVLFTTEHSIDQLKQTILQLAVMGKLVPQDPNDEPASVLLEKIAAEKEQLIKDKVIKKQKPLPPISEDEKPFELPKGWEWCSLQSLITIMDAGWSPACPPEPSPSDDIWGVLKTTAVQSMEYREFENKVLAANKEPRSQYEVKVGDILITRAGPKNRVGVSCLVQNTRPKLMISDKIIRFHLVEMGMSERYLSLCLNAGATAEYLESTKSGMAESQMNISQDKLKSAPIPLAPNNEQFLIIKKVDELMALCDELKVRLQKSQTTQLHLADAMAEQALNS
ncbi:Type I restriction enzyme EcoEI specificity protein [Oleispira antarctica RB-8]|uniref:Type I restriction enzyme EcoEI specificity protein n=1 Tax=Oleispira antarctica RB-8 TaxID=698738 RepID=R4YKB7_OLEAN|nr:Type I restriction enzyme EcoEI specificity protein [Oleispira antarctica RB-8]